MAIDPTEIELTREQKERLAALAERSRKPYAEIVDEWLAGALPSNDGGMDATECIPRSAFDAFSAVGAIGCFNGPSDLSTSLDQDRSHNDANEITDIDSSSTHVAHDAVGNMTKVPKSDSWSAHYDLTYDAWNRLVKIEDGATTVAEYEYDGLNRRIVKDVGDDTFHFYYNTNWQVLEVQKDGVTDPVEQYLWHWHYIDALAIRCYDANEDGDFTDTDEFTAYMFDANFNVTGVCRNDSSYPGDATVIERYKYDPYGNVTVLDADFSDDADGVSDIDNPYTFTGRRFDTATGLYYFRARYYDSQLGRFIGRDPIGYAGAVNPYEYVWSSPLRAVDSHGLQPDNLDDLIRVTESGRYVSGQMTGFGVVDFVDPRPPNRTPSTPPPVTVRQLSRMERDFLAQVIEAIFIPEKHNPLVVRDRREKAITELVDLLDKVTFVRGPRNPKSFGAINVLGASAITINQWVYFRPTDFPSKALSPRRLQALAMAEFRKADLISHEVTHVVQQAKYQHFDACYLGEFVGRSFQYRAISTEIEAFSVGAAVKDLLQQNPSAFGRKLTPAEQLFLKRRYEIRKQINEAEVGQPDDSPVTRTP